jgi:rhodanese-related sulfurtransferase
MRHSASALVAACVLILALSVTSLQAAEAPRMDKEKAKELLGAGRIVLIDVRQPSDWDSSAKKIKGAIREDPKQVDKWAEKYPKDQALLLYCA